MQKDTGEVEDLPLAAHVGVSLFCILIPNMNELGLDLEPC